MEDNISKEQVIEVNVLHVLLQTHNSSGLIAYGMNILHGI